MTSTKTPVAGSRDVITVQSRSLVITGAPHTQGQVIMGGGIGSSCNSAHPRGSVTFKVKQLVSGGAEVAPRRSGSKESCHQGGEGFFPGKRAPELGPMTRV